MNKLTKRLLSLVVVVVMLMTMMPTVFAEEPAYTDWDGSGEAVVDGAYLKLTCDLEISENYSVNGKTVTIDLDGHKITSTKAIRFMYITGGAKVTLKNGTIEMPGLAKETSSVMGGIIQTSASAGNELNLDNMTITRTTATTNLVNGGIMYARAIVNITNSTLQVVAPEATDETKLEGGLIKVSSGTTLTIENSTLHGTRAKYGGCVFATGTSNTVIKNSVLTGGTATSGRGGDLYTGGSATAEVQSGTVGSMYFNGAAYTLANGVVSYENPVKFANNSEAVVCADGAYTTYAALTDALAAAAEGNEVILAKDITAEEVAVPAGATLNLNGKVLTAAAVKADGAKIADKGAGKLVTDSASFNADNAQLPMKNGNEYTFETVAFAQNLNVDEKLYKFYIAGEAANTLIDDAILAGDEVAIDVVVTWTNANNEPKTKTFTLDAALLAQYAGNWDTKMITLTFVDLTGVSDLTCTAQISANGVTVKAA